MIVIEYSWNLNKKKIEAKIERNESESKRPLHHSNSNSKIEEKKKHSKFERNESISFDSWRYFFKKSKSIEF